MVVYLCLYRSIDLEGREHGCLYTKYTKSHKPEVRIRMMFSFGDDSRTGVEPARGSQA